MSNAYTLSLKEFRDSLTESITNERIRRWGWERYRWEKGGQCRDRPYVSPRLECFPDYVHLVFFQKVHFYELFPKQDEIVSPSGVENGSHGRLFKVNAKSRTNNPHSISNRINQDQRIDPETTHLPGYLSKYCVELNYLGINYTKGFETWSEPRLSRPSFELSQSCRISGPIQTITSALVINFEYPTWNLQDNRNAHSMKRIKK